MLEIGVNERPTKKRKSEKKGGGSKVPTPSKQKNAAFTTSVPSSDQTLPVEVLYRPSNLSFSLSHEHTDCCYHGVVNTYDVVLSLLL